MEEVVVPEVVLVPEVGINVCVSFPTNEHTVLVEERGLFLVSGNF